MDVAVTQHILVILRVFLAQAKWDIAASKEKKLVYCDCDGRLSTTAVAACANGKEAGEVVKDGVFYEVLDHQMDLEEPTRRRNNQQSVQ